MVMVISVGIVEHHAYLWNLRSLRAGLTLRRVSQAKADEIAFFLRVSLFKGYKKRIFASKNKVLVEFIIWLEYFALKMVWLPKIIILLKFIIMFNCLLFYIYFI